MEESLIRALKAIDNQVAREMQRTPSERDVHGAQKWEPYQVRVENLTSFLLNSLGAEEISLDGILVLSRTLTKTLRMVVEDLGHEGLGEVRTEYCRAALEDFQDEGSKGLSVLTSANDDFN